VAVNDIVVEQAQPQQDAARTSTQEVAPPVPHNEHAATRLPRNKNAATTEQVKFLDLDIVREALGNTNLDEGVKAQVEASIIEALGKRKEAEDREQYPIELQKCRKVHKTKS